MRVGGPISNKNVTVQPLANNNRAGAAASTAEMRKEEGE